MTKKNLYAEAKSLAPLRKSSFGMCWCCISYREKKAEAERQEVTAKKEAKAWDKDWWYSDFEAQLEQDCLDYDELGYDDAEAAEWCFRCKCGWCCYNYTDQEYCPVHWGPPNDGGWPDSTLDLGTLLDQALMKRDETVRAEFEELGWSEVGSEFASPDMGWEDDGEELFEGDFELI